MTKSNPIQRSPGSEDATDRSGSNELPEPRGKEGEGEDELNTMPNPSGSTPTSTPLNTVPSTNSQRPPAASTPLPTLAPPLPVVGLVGAMTDLRFDTGMGDGGTKFDSGPDSLEDTTLSGALSPVAMPGSITYLSSDMSKVSHSGHSNFKYRFRCGTMTRRFLPHQQHFNPSTSYDGPLDMRKTVTEPRFKPIRENNPWFDPIVVHDGPSLDTT